MVVKSYKRLEGVSQLQSFGCSREARFVYNTCIILGYRRPVIQQYTCIHEATPVEHKVRYDS